MESAATQTHCTALFCNHDVVWWLWPQGSLSWTVFLKRKMEEHLTLDLSMDDEEINTSPVPGVQSETERQVSWVLHGSNDHAAFYTKKNVLDIYSLHKIPLC